MTVNSRRTRFSTVLYLGLGVYDVTAPPDVTTGKPRFSTVLYLGLLLLVAPDDTSSAAALVAVSLSRVTSARSMAALSTMIGTNGTTVIDKP